MRISIGFILLAIALSWSNGKTLWSAEADQGEVLYIQYCSSCHGKDGRGGGSVSPYLKLKIPDLSLLKKNHKGIYPLDDVMAAIDGRRSVRAHGDRQMPVWGEVFHKDVEKQKYSELTSLLRAKMIAEYVAQLQR
ncbi:MAG TPA: cytochrome c [Candidatus Binatia bacterium]